MTQHIPGSSKCVKFVPFHQKNLPKGTNVTQLEDPGIIDNCNTIVCFTPADL